MIEKIKTYFLKSPMIEDESNIYTDFLPKNSSEYAIYPIGSSFKNSVIKSFLGGDSLKEYPFIFACKFTYSTINDLNNITNSIFFEKLQDWIEENNRKKIFPLIDNVQKIEILQSGNIFIVDQNQQVAEYRMTLRLIYYKEVKK